MAAQDPAQCPGFIQMKLALIAWSMPPTPLWVETCPNPALCSWSARALKEPCEGKRGQNATGELNATSTSRSGVPNCQVWLSSGVAKMPKLCNQTLTAKLEMILNSPKTPYKCQMNAKEHCKFEAPRSLKPKYRGLNN